MPLTRRKPEQPVLWLIAGPNGSGKSSFYSRTDIEGWSGTVWIVNPDILTATLKEAEGLSQRAANLAAVRRIESWLSCSIEVHKTVGVETVLSTGKYRKLVRQARRLGFEIRLIYVFVRTSEMQAERIKIRVSEGGHNVPMQKIKSRRMRSIRQLMWFARNVDRLYLFDNSRTEPLLVAYKEPETNFISWPMLPSELHAMLRRYGIQNGSQLSERLSG